MGNHGDGFTGALARAWPAQVGSYAIGQGTPRAVGQPYLLTVIPGTLVISFTKSGADASDALRMLQEPASTAASRSTRTLPESRGRWQRARARTAAAVAREPARFGCAGSRPFGGEGAARAAAPNESGQPAMSSCPIQPDQPPRLPIGVEPQRQIGPGMAVAQHMPSRPLMNAGRSAGPRHRPSGPRAACSCSIRQSRHYLEAGRLEEDELVDPCPERLIGTGQLVVHPAPPAAVRIVHAFQLVDRLGELPQGLWPSPHAPALQDQHLGRPGNLLGRAGSSRALSKRGSRAGPCASASIAASPAGNVVRARHAAGAQQRVDGLGEPLPGGTV